MTEYVFRLQNGYARLIKGDSFPTDRAILRAENALNGVLLIGGERRQIAKDGVLLDAKALPGGIHTLLILSEGTRFEGPPVAVYAGTIYFLPPTHERMADAEARLESAQNHIQALEKQVAALEDRIQNTNIF